MRRREPGQLGQAAHVPAPVKAARGLTQKEKDRAVNGMRILGEPVSGCGRAECSAGPPDFHPDSSLAASLRCC